LIEAREGHFVCRNADLTTALQFIELYARRITALPKKERRGLTKSGVVKEKE
jgi:hypothetical protein